MATATDIDLAQWDDDFESLEVPENTFEDVPDGKYQVSVESAELRTSQEGNPYLGWQLNIIAGQHTGRKLFHRNMLNTPDNIRFLKKDLCTCGMTDLKKLSQLEARLDELKGVVLEVTVKTKNNFQNIYINKRLNIAQGAAKPAATTKGRKKVEKDLSAF